MAGETYRKASLYYFLDTSLLLPIFPLWLQVYNTAKLLLALVGPEVRMLFYTLNHRESVYTQQPPYWPLDGRSSMSNYGQQV